MNSLLISPIRNSFLELSHLFVKNYKSLSRYLAAALISFALVSSLGYYKFAIWCLTWILLGVASSVGFGFGMHTFVLFLAPHIAAVTMAATSCNSLDFPEPPYPDEIICPDYHDNGPISFFEILRKVGLESFLWGLGTAIGELPPYLAARLRAEAISRKRVAGDQVGQNSEVSGWEVWMIKIINKIGFVGILLCAAIPNPLFDAAGVASGVAQIPFISFFGATLIGKAIIKVSLQSSFIILAFHNNNLDSFVQRFERKLCELIPLARNLNINKTFNKILEEQRNNVLSQGSGEPKQPSMISTLFNWLICACFALFFISLINALDKQYRDRNASKNQLKDK